MFKVGDIVRYCLGNNRIEDHFLILDIDQYFYTTKIVVAKHRDLGTMHRISVSSDYPIELVSRKISCNYPHEKVRIRYGRI